MLNIRLQQDLQDRRCGELPQRVDDDRILVVVLVVVPSMQSIYSSHYDTRPTLLLPSRLLQRVVALVLHLVRRKFRLKLVVPREGCYYYHLPAPKNNHCSSTTRCFPSPTRLNTTAGCTT